MLGQRGRPWLPERARKLLLNTDRLVLTPLALAGRSAHVAHVVDPGNVIYLDVLRARGTICTVHDLIPHLAEAGRLAGFTPTGNGRRLMRAIRSRMARVDRVVCVSEATRRDLLELVDVDPDRVRVIPNAVFQPMAPASDTACTDLRRRLGIPAEAALVLHVGRNFYKNHRGVLEVFARLRRHRPDAHLLLVTPPKADITEAVGRLGLGAFVHIVPQIAAEDMATLYTTADLLLFPSLYEGFGYPVLEAQMCGTPVIGSNAGSLPEVAGDAARLFDPDDVNGMADAAVSLLEDADAAADLVHAGHRNAARFPHERWVADHVALWRELGVTPTAQEHRPVEPA